MSAKKKGSPAIAKTLRWSERAIRDLEDIEDFIAEDQPAAAARWIERLLRAAERAGTLPLSGRVVPEISRVDVREVLVRSYRIVYLVQEREVTVLTVFEGHQRFPDDVIGGDE